MRRSAAVVLMFAIVLAYTLRSRSQEFGTISFPNSGAASAQEPFLTGVKALHNFQFDEAAEAFRRARQEETAHQGRLF